MVIPFGGQKGAVEIRAIPCRPEEACALVMLRAMAAEGTRRRSVASERRELERVDRQTTAHTFIYLAEWESSPNLWPF